MNIAYDTLFDGTSEKSLASWGFEQSSCTGEKFNSDTDYWEGTITKSEIADDSLFAFEQSVKIYTGRISGDGSDNSFSGGTLKFTGIRTVQLGKASGSGQGVKYRFEGPQYALEKTIYQQQWKGSAINPLPISEVMLFTSTRNNTNTMQFISVGDTLQDILQWVLDEHVALGLPAPFQYTGRTLHSGAIDLSGSFPSGSDPRTFVYTFSVSGATTIDAAFFTLFYNTFSARPMTAMQALQKVLEFSPRTNIAFDYSTSPPTIYIRSIDNFPGLTMPLFDGTSHKSINIQRRDDLKVRSVVIKYRINNTVSGQQVVDYITDKFGPNGSNSGSDPDGGPRVMIDFLDLQGYSITYESGHLDCEPLPNSFSQAQLRAWWSGRRGGEQAKLLDSRVRFSQAIPAPSYTYASNGFDSIGTAVIGGQFLTAADVNFYTQRLVRGSHHAWMKTNPGNANVLSVKVRASGVFSYSEWDVVATGDTPGQLPTNESTSDAATNGNNNAKANTHEHHVNLELTNGTTGTYTTVASESAGEIAYIGPGGLANYLFSALNVYQYEGEYVKIAAAFDNGISILNKLNLSGGRLEWTTMNAQIQSVREDYGSHETSVKIGLSKHLSSGQFQSLLNMWRNRRPWVNPLIRADNTAGGNATVDMQQTSGSANTTDGEVNHQAVVTRDYQNQTDPTSTIQGEMNHDSSLIHPILVATTPTAVDSTPINKMAPRETLFCDMDGNQFYAIVLRTGYYSKP